MLVAALPLLLLAVNLRVQLSGEAGATATAAPAAGAAPARGPCPFPGAGAGHRRLIVAIVDSLSDESALDASIMPWLGQHRQESTWGRMQPCLAQLSLICFRTIFEGAEPLIAASLNNFRGMTVRSESIIQRLAARGVRVGAIADLPFITLYRSSLARAASFEDRVAADGDRDTWAHETTFQWLDDPTLDLLITHTIDTDAVAHRMGVTHPKYLEKYRETDRFLKALAGRLGPRDSLLILGDHGHDARGYHSTGVPSTTVYFASGAPFAAGRQVDLTMPSAYALMGAVTCEAPPPGYTGDTGEDALALAGTTVANGGEAAGPNSGGTAGPGGAGQSPAGQPPARHPPAGRSLRGARLLTAELPALLTLLALVALFARALRPESSGGGAGFAPTLVLLPALALPHVAALWGAAAVTAHAGRRVFAERWKHWSVRGLWLVALAHGLGAQILLVRLQSEVNPAWSIGFWCALALTIVATGLLLRRLSAQPAGISIGFAAWGITFFVLYLGPYYYSSARNLPFGLTWLLLAVTWSQLRARRDLLRCVLLALIPLIPLDIPVMKEWQVRYPILVFSNQLGAVPVVAICAGMVALAIAISPSRAIWRRALPLIAVMVGVGLATDTGHSAILGEVLLAISYLHFHEAVARLGPSAPRVSGYLVPIAQASYAFFLFHLLLGALRFANVDFRFALQIASIEGGEGAAALRVLPLVLAKYFVPTTALIALGPRLDPRSLLVMLIRGAVMAVCLFGMDLAAARTTALFEVLETQEIALFAVLYLSVWVAFALRIGRAEGAPALAARPAIAGAPNPDWNTGSVPR